MYVNTKTRLMCDLMGPKLRLLFEGGFYSSAAFIQDYGIPVVLHIKAGIVPVEADVKARFLLTSGFYSNQVFLCVSTLKPGLCADNRHP